MHLHLIWPAIIPWVVGLSSPRTSEVDLSSQETTLPASPTGLAAKSRTLASEIIVEGYLLGLERQSSLDPAQNSKWITEVEQYNSDINSHLSGIPGFPGSVFSNLITAGISEVENAYRSSSWYSEVLDVEITAAHNLNTILEDILSETVLPVGFRTATEVRGSFTTTLTIPLVEYAPIHPLSGFSPISNTLIVPGTVTSTATLGGTTPSHGIAIPMSKPPANSRTRAQKLGLGLGLGLGLSLLLSIGAVVLILRRRRLQKQKDHHASYLDTVGGAMEKSELDATNTRNELHGASQSHEADGTNRHEIDGTMSPSEADGIQRHELGGKSELEEAQRYELDGMDQDHGDNSEV